MNHKELYNDEGGSTMFNNVQHEYVAIAVDSPTQELKFSIEAEFRVTEESNPNLTKISC